MNVDELVERGQQIFGRRWRWMRGVAVRIVEAYGDKVRPRKSTIEQFLMLDPGFSRAYARHPLRLEYAASGRPQMCPVGAATDWGCRSPLCTRLELADWLGLTPQELDWFADQRRLACKQDRPKLSHYRYHLLSGKSGKIRVIEAPKPRLRAIQRRILTEILDQVPPHAAAHGFRHGHSIKTFARPHVAKDVVIKLDLQDFFPSIPHAQVHAIFRSIGYPESVADALAALCTNSVPGRVWRKHDSAALRMQNPDRQYAQPHLPQGAPTSPAIANLCAFRMDCRLTGLARSMSAEYTRYADDLAFSGNGKFQRVARHFHIVACAIAMQEGFHVHHRKTRIMTKSVRQKIAGIVVNRRLNIPRQDFDRLKAQLTNCIRHGADTQNTTDHPNFRHHLEGRVSFVESIHPERGRRLRTLLNQIHW